MTDERHERLIDDYLQGRSTAAETREIDLLVRNDERFRAALATAAHDESALERLFGGRSAIGIGMPTTGRSRRGVAAAMAGIAAVAATAGWLLLTGVDARGGACRVVETRGSVLLLSRVPGEPATPVEAGDAIATERRIWTCPWGAVALRLADGSRLQLDRDSEAMLACGLRPRVELIKGTAFVTRGDAAAGTAVLKTAQASIEVGHGLAAVVVDDDRTIVEVAEGETFLTTAEGKTTRVAEGQVAVLEKGGAGDVEVRMGRLQWQLPDEPSAARSASGGS